MHANAVLFVEWCTALWRFEADVHCKHTECLRMYTGQTACWLERDLSKPQQS